MHKKTLHILLFSLLAAAFSSCEPKGEYNFEDTPLGNFDALWQIIDTKYCFIESKGIDWNAIGKEYREKLLNHDEAVTDRVLFDLLACMLDSLNDGHVNLYSDFDISRNRSWHEGYPINYSSSLVYGARYLGSDYKIAGGFNYEVIDEGKIGYARYESFSSGFSTMNFFHIMDYFRDCKGMIIDLRSNGGGSLTYSERLLSFFFKEKTTIGYIQHKTGYGHNDFSEMETLYVEPSEYLYWGRPLVVLCNRGSYSATNHFVNSIRLAPNVLTMGGKTGGGSGMPLSYELPNGWLLRFSAVPMYNTEKQCIEDGISPDVEITMDSVSASIGRDAIIEAAVELMTREQ